MECYPEQSSSKHFYNTLTALTPNQALSFQGQGPFNKRLSALVEHIMLLNKALKEQNVYNGQIPVFHVLVGIYAHAKISENTVPIL